MGSPKHPSGERAGLAAALFSKVQRRVLACLFGQPERSFFASELIALAGGGSGAVQRELQRLTDSGLVTTTRIGLRKHFQANAASPIYAELVGIARKTVGLAEPLREALAPLAQRMRAAFVFGSVAKRTDTAASDIDLIVLSDDLDYADIYTALQRAEAELGRKVNPAVYSLAEWRARQRRNNAFVARVISGPKIFLVGGEGDLA